MKIVGQKTLMAGLRVSVTTDNDGIMQNLNQRFQEALEKGILAGGSEMLSTWGNTARSSLKSSRSYVSALQEGNEPRYEGNPLAYSITQGQKTRDGKRSVGILLEEGIEPFDMKEKILKGRKSVKVRFEYGSSIQSHSRKLSDEINKVANRYNKYRDDTKGLQHGQVKEMFGDEAADQINPQKTKNFTALTGSKKIGMGGFGLDKPIEGVGWKQAWGKEVKYKWKTREFNGLRGETTKSGKEIAVHTYAVYRTISKKSAADSWIHPGIRPRRILETAGSIAIPKIKELIETSVQNAIESQS